MKRTLLLLVTTGALALMFGCEPAQLNGPAGDPNSDDTDRIGERPIDQTSYEFISYDALLATIEVTLGVAETPYVGAVADPDDPSSPDNPKEDPVGFLKDRGVSVGKPIFDPNSPNGTLNLGFSSLGMKTWTFASAGACAKAMPGPKGTELFPNGATDYDMIYLAFLGRYPTGKEIADIDSLRVQFPTEVEQKVAVCTGILGTMEFLTRN